MKTFTATFEGTQTAIDWQALVCLLRTVKVVKGHSMELKERSEVWDTEMELVVCTSPSLQPGFPQREAEPGDNQGTDCRPVFAASGWPEVPLMPHRLLGCCQSKAVAWPQSPLGRKRDAWDRVEQMQVHCCQLITGMTGLS